MAAKFEAKTVFKVVAQQTEPITSVIRVEGGDLDILLWHDQVAQGILNPVRQESTGRNLGAFLQPPGSESQLQRNWESLAKTIDAFPAADGATAIEEDGEGKGSLALPQSPDVVAALARNAEISGLFAGLQEIQSGGRFGAQAKELRLLTYKESHALLNGDEPGLDKLLTDTNIRTQGGARFCDVATYAVLLARFADAKEYTEELVRQLQVERRIRIDLERRDLPYLTDWLVSIHQHADQLNKLYAEKRSVAEFDAVESGLREIARKHVKHITRLAQQRVDIDE